MTGVNFACPRTRKRTSTAEEEFQPHMHTDETGVARLPESGIGCEIWVGNTLGVRFPENVCENASGHGYRTADLTIARQQWITVRWDCIVIRQHAVDLLAANIQPDPFVDLTAGLLRGAP